MTNAYYAFISYLSLDSHCTALIFQNESLIDKVLTIIPQTMEELVLEIITAICSSPRTAEALYCKLDSGLLSVRTFKQSL